jgi:hypothetical protein
VGIAVDDKGFTVAHHMANGVTYIRGDQYAVRAFQIDKNDPNLAIWVGLRRNDPDVVMVGYLQYVPNGTGDRWHYWEVVANRAEPWTIDHPELVSSCWGDRKRTKIVLTPYNKTFRQGGLPTQKSLLFGWTQTQTNGGFSEPSEATAG